MPFSYTCPYCGKTTIVDDCYAGQSGPCVGCGQMVTMPGTPTMSGTPGPGEPVPTPAGAGAYQPLPRKGMGAGGVVLIVIAILFVFLFIGGILVAMLLPAVQAAREAARRMSCTNQIKQIELAMHNYADAYKQFPPAYTVDETGKPLHSWRTLILPYMEQQAVYNLLKMDEPWDSPHNLAILENLTISDYQCPSNSSNTIDNFTNYVMVLGPNCVSDGPNSSRFRDLVNGSSNTINIIETTAPIPWYEPQDINIDELFNADGSLSPIWEDTNHPGIVNAGFCDGHVQSINTDINPETLRAMLEGKVQNNAANLDYNY